MSDLTIGILSVSAIWIIPWFVFSWAEYWEYSYQAPVTIFGACEVNTRGFLVSYISFAIFISIIFTVIGLAINWNMFLVWFILGGSIVLIFLLIIINPVGLIEFLYRFIRKAVDKAIPDFVIKNR